MPSPRAVLRDIDLLGLNPSKAHSLIKASGHLGHHHVEADVKEEKSEKHEKHGKDKGHGHVEKDSVEVKKTETVVEKNDDKETTTKTVETKKVEVKVEEKENDKKDLGKSTEKVDDKEDRRGKGSRKGYSPTNQGISGNWWLTQPRTCV